MRSSNSQFDVIVVGGGPAGIASAVSAAQSGKRVAIADDNPALGGQIWRGETVHSDPAARAWISKLRESSVQLFPGTRVFDQPVPGTLNAETLDGRVAFDYGKLILATGARERFLPFPGWTLQNVMGAGALQALVKAGLPIQGKRVVVAGTGPLLLAVASYLKKHGAIVVAVCEQASRASLAAFAGFAVTGLFADPLRHATIIAHNNVTNRLQDAKTPDEAVPGDTYLEDRRRKSHNGDSVEMFYEPNAVTDGDSIVFFRRADVIVAGNILDLTRYPMIDAKNGGSVEGEIKALNDILNRTNYEHEGEGGTYVVPGHGFLADEHEVVEYRDMVVIVRDRVKGMIAIGATLAQVKAARVTADYDTRYGANTGPWTTEMFVEAVYNSLKPAAKTN